MRDALAVLQASTTKTASFNGAGYDLITGTRQTSPIYAQVNYSAAANASGSNTVTYSVEHSDDNTTYYALSSGAGEVMTLSTTAQAGTINIPVVTSKRYIRLVATVAGAGTGPSVTYDSYLLLAPSVPQP